MPEKIELIPKAEIGKGYALIDDDKIEIHVSGVMGVLKAWLLGEENLPLGNIAQGTLLSRLNLAPYYGVLITQSGRQMFYAAWRSADEEKSPLPPMHWEKITDSAFPTLASEVRLALSNRSFFKAFKKYGYYLFGRDGKHFALALKHSPADPSPFPDLKGVKTAQDYIYVVF